MSTIESLELPSTLGVAVRATVAVEDIPAFFAGAFREIDAAIRACAGARPAGPPFAIYYSAPPGPVDVAAVFPVSMRVPARGRAMPIEIAGGPALQVLFVGPYEAMAPVYADIARFMKENALEPSGPPREVYLSDPAAEPDPKRWRTLVVQPTTRLFRERGVSVPAS